EPRPTLNPGQRSLSPTDMYHRARRRDKIGLADMMPLFLAANHLPDKVLEFRIRGATTDQLVQLVFPDREQTSANLAIGSDTDPATVATKGVRDGGYDADFAHSVIETIAPRGLAASVGNFDQSTILAHALENLIQIDDHRRRPEPVFFERHEFNEAH